jgi:hypothetical protein
VLELQLHAAVCEPTRAWSPVQGVLLAACSPRCEASSVPAAAAYPSGLPQHVHASHPARQQRVGPAASASGSSGPLAALPPMHGCRAPGPAGGVRNLTLARVCSLRKCGQPAAILAGRSPRGSPGTETRTGCPGSTWAAPQRSSRVLPLPLCSCPAPPTVQRAATFHAGRAPWCCSKRGVLIGLDVCMT